MRFSGKTPNTSWKAYPINMLILQNQRFIPLDNGYGSYVSLCETPNQIHLIPQRTDEWKKARQGVIKDNVLHPIMCTASVVGYMLGFCEPKSVEILGLPSWMISHDRVVSQLEKRALSISGSTQVNFTWGNEHEPNALKTLLDCRYLNDRYPNFTIEESGIWPINISTDSDPLYIAASFDGILVHEGSPKSILEVKCVSPFSLDRESQLYQYRKPIPYESIYPLYVGQTQKQLLIAERSFNTSINTIFGSWTPTANTSLFDISHNTEYTSLMCTLLKQMRDEFIITGADIPENFWHNEDHLVYKEYQRFLYLTKEMSDNARSVSTVPSFVYGGGNLFLDEINM